MSGSRRFVAAGGFATLVRKPSTGDAFNAVQTDPQLANRFEPELVARWTMSDDYLRLLASFEVAFSLAQPSKLAERTLAQKILNLSEGTIGEISALLTWATV